MTTTFEPLPCPDSPLCRLDPRWKLAALVLAAVLVASVRTLPPTGVALLGALALAAVVRLPWRWYLGRVAAVGLFVALFTLPLPFLLGGSGPSWAIGPVTVSWLGVSTALLVMAKALTVLTLMLVLLASAPLEDTLKAAHALRVPGLLVQLAVLTYRYIFVLEGELARLRVALRVRGYRNRADRHSYRTIGHVAGALLVRGYERAERVGQAMRCRGFGGQFHSLTRFRTTAADVIAAALLVAGAAALVAWDVLRR
ncbi:MAG TPA: cobalt ECF transporter T component CbiQ [Gemmataceae bacterium]|nr:cobalt ECF transporter T component CbiQ [Gemmataceae bacterium]